MKKKSFKILIILLCLPVFSQANDFGPHPAGYFPGDPIPARVAYLTFDDGPSDWTDLVLDILKKKNVKATFFICANWRKGSTIKYNSFEKYRNTLERIIFDGHSIGNHTRTHQNLAKLSKEKAEEEIDLNQKLLDQALGPESVKMYLIRPPFGSPWMTPNTLEARKKVTDVIARRGLAILWSRHFFSGDALEWVKGDWYEAGKKVDITQEEFKKKMIQIYERLIKRVDGKGMVILFHDTHRTTIEVLPRIIDKLRELGYRFETIDSYIKWRNEKMS